MLWLRISGAAVKTASSASVIRASRVMGQADGGEILVTNVVRELVEGKEYVFGDRGAADLKGFDEAVRMFEVRWGE